MRKPRSVMLLTIVAMVLVTGCGRSAEQLASDELRSAGCDVRFRPNGEALVPFWVQAPERPLPEEFMESLGKLPSVETLILARTEFRENDFNRLPVMPVLKMLDLSDNQLSDGAVTHVVRLRGIETLILDGNPLTDASVADLIQLRSVRVLSVQRTQISAAGADRLREALPGCIVSESVDRSPQISN